MLCQMNTRVSAKYYLVPLLYIGLIGTLLYLQYAREEPFRLQVGALEVNGRTIVGSEAEPVVANIVLQTGGLRFSFSRTAPIELRLADGSSQPFAVRSYASMTDGVEVDFSAGLALRFQMSGPALQTLTITPTLPGGIQVSSVTFPFSVVPGAALQAAGGIPALAVTAQSPATGAAETRILTLPFGSKINPQTYALTIAASGDRFGPSVYSRASTPNQDPVAYWFEQSGQLPDDKSYAQSVSDYLDKAWSGWTGDRYNPAADTWQMRDGSPAFSEPILVDVLSAALGRGIYPATIATFRAAVVAHSSDLTALSMPFLGNIQATFDAYRPTFDTERATVDRLLSRGGGAVLSTPNLLTFATDHASTGTLQNVLGALKTAPAALLDLPTSLNLLNDDLQAARLGYSPQEFIAAATKLIGVVVLPRIVHTTGGFYVLSGDSAADVANTVFAGSLLLSAGDLAKQRVLTGIGRELIVSALSLSDSDGFLPGRLSIAGDTVTGTEGFVPPERIYRWVAPDAYYPREISLAGSGDPGVWLWAASKLVSADSSPQALTVTLDFPAGMAEYLVLGGVKPFTGIKLYGTPWASDPQFEQYNAGWVYDPVTQSLYVKLFHQVQQESIEIDY